MINCVHYLPHEMPPLGVCAAGIKINPSPGACEGCARREPKDASQPAILGPKLAGDISARAAKIDLAIAGPKLWAELHQFAASIPEPIDQGKAIDWLRGFARRLPCGDCRNHWLEMVKRTPPDLSSRDAFFDWTAERHNEVNQRLGKPVMPPHMARSEAVNSTTIN